MSQVDMMKLREELAARDIEWSGDWDNNGMTTSWESLDGQHFQCFQRGWNGNLAIIIRDVTPDQAIAATLGSGTLTAEQVREAIMSVDRWEKPMGNTGLTNTHLIIRDDAWQAIADELNAELGSGTCELSETDSYSNANEVIHVLECSACGETCEHVNGSYPRCPHCGRKTVSA